MEYNENIKHRDGKEIQSLVLCLVAPRECMVIEGG